MRRNDRATLVVRAVKRKCLLALGFIESRYARGALHASASEELAGGKANPTQRRFFMSDEKVG
jgi:hypothetical protein